jgi:hypothetical protein
MTAKTPPIRVAASASATGIKITCSHASVPDIVPIAMSMRDSKNRFEAVANGSVQYDGYAKEDGA